MMVKEGHREPSRSASAAILDVLGGQFVFERRVFCDNGANEL
jgi:hypothetical protein